MNRHLAISLITVGAVALGSVGYALAASPGSPLTDDVVVRSATVAVPAAKPGGFAKSSFSVACRGGETAIGGGHRASRGTVLLAGSYPNGSSGWTVTLANAGTRRVPATVYAICLRGSGGTTTGTTTDGTTTGTTGTSTDGSTTGATTED